ncbi:MAG TPA: efflux transporter outer membrane subunit, partial [Gammaproteobacteria bacterium]|nr:efflux transporter outer membrane subunit [Gammaproteobacteria bacterium]
MRHRKRISTSCICAAAVILASGCTTLGPDFVKPQVAKPESWTETPAGAISSAPLVHSQWWKVFNDPVLDGLVETAYAQNLPLQISGLRILEARAQLGIATGQLYPQVQQANGSATAVKISNNSPNYNPLAEDSFMDYQVGFDAAWEPDFWGRFRRGIEAADANLASSLADYDNALVSLTAEVARVYVTIRTLEERLAIALNNIELQQESLRIATVRYDNGATTELDVQQALTNLSETQASVPTIKRALRRSKNALSILLGMLPSDLAEMLGPPGQVPVAPQQVAAGVPAELLRRRPDVRSAELRASARSAFIGIAEADLYPTFTLAGSIGYQTSDTGSSSAGDLFDSDSFRFAAGPGFSWNIFNYGRLKNNVRVQDARYQQAIVNYQNTVLKAYQEVEDAMVGFVASQQESAYRRTASGAARRSTDIARIQYREGAVDFQRVIDSERSLVNQQDRWTTSRGDIALNL